MVLALVEWWRMPLAPCSLTDHARVPAAESGEESSGMARLSHLLLRRRVGWQRFLPFLTLILAVWLLLRLWLDYAYLGAALYEVLSADQGMFAPGSIERERAFGMIFGRLWLWAVVGWLI